MAVLWWLSILIIAGYVGWWVVGGRRLLAHYDAPVVALGIGLGVCAHLVYALGIAQLYYEWLLRAATISAACIIVLIALTRKRAGAVKLLRDIWRRVPRARTWAFWCMIPVVGILVYAIGMLFIITAVPTMLIDSYMYHLSVPKAYLGHHGIFAIPYNLCSNFPLMPQMLYTWVMGLMPNAIVECKMASLLYAIMLGWLTYCLGRRFFSAAVGVTGITLIMLMRDVGQFATTAHVDLEMAFYVCLGYYLFMVWALHKPERRVLGLGSLAFGFAIAANVPGAIYFVMGIATLVVSVGVIRFLGRREATRRSEGQNPTIATHAHLNDLRRQLAFLLIPALVVGMLWWGKNVIVTGNPLYPFFSESIPTTVEYRQMALDQFAKEQFYTRFAVPLTLHDWKEFGNYLLVYLRNVYYLEANRMILFMSLALLLGIAGRFYHDRATIFLLILSAFGIPVLLRSPAWRFLIGLYPLILILFWGSVQKWVKRNGLFALIAALVIVLSLKGFWNYNYPRLKAHGIVLSREAITEYYERELPHYDFVEFISNALHKDDVLLVTENIPELPLLPVAIIPNPHMYSKDMLESLAEDRQFTSNEIFAYLRRLGVTHILTRNPLEGKLEEFKKQHLDLIYQYKGIRLFALLPYQKLQLENQSPF
jgi:hypothetical protein